MGKEPLLIAVVVLVVEVDLELLHAWLQQVEVPALRVRTSGADELDVRILLADGIAELLESGGEHRAKATVSLVVVPLLITNAQELEVEGSGVTHLSANLTPLRIGRAVGKLDEVEGILDIWLEVVDSYMNTRLGGVGVLELT